MSGVQSLDGNLILTEKGEVYVYGISNNHVYKEPYKLLDNVSSINGRYIITKSNELLEMVDNQPVHIADNIKDAGYGDYQGYYITTQHDLYVFGDFKRCYFQTETPIKVASNVKNASVNEYGYAYLTHSNDLYLATPFMEKNVDGKEYPHHILEGGVLIAHDVKSYFYYNTLLYLDNRHTMHAFGYDNWLLMPYSMDEINGDMVLFDNITSFFGDSTTAVACASDGSMYIWGENNIGMLDPKNEGLFTSSIGKPLKITF